MTASCGHPLPPGKTPARAARSGEAGAQPTGGRPGDGPDEAATVPILGWISVSDAPWLIRTIARVASGAGEALPPGHDELAAKVLIAKLGGLDPRAGLAIDLSRPVTLALLDLPAPEGTPPPLVVLLPIQGAAAFEQALAQASVPVLRQPEGCSFPTKRGAARVRYLSSARTGTWAMLSYQQALLEEPRALWSAVRPALDGALRHEAPVVVHLEAARLYRRHAAEIEVMAARFLDASGAAGQDPEKAFALRRARGMVRFLDSLQSVELLAAGGGPSDPGLEVRLRVDGTTDGAWARRVAAQPTGPAWGVSLLPADSVLVYATRRGSAATGEEITAAAGFLGDAGDPPASSEARAAWRQALTLADSQLTGEVAYAMWPGRNGGIGLGGAYRVRDAASARRDVLAAYRRIGGAMAGAIAEGLRLDPRRFHLDVKVTEDALQVAGTPVDEVSVGVRFPKTAPVEARLFHSLFGPRLTLATAFVGDTAAFALGRDARARLSAMVAAADGHPARSLVDDARFQKALAYHPGGRVSLCWVSTAGLTGFLERLVIENTRARRGGSDDAGPPSTALPGPLTRLVGEGSILVATNASGRRYELATSFPSSALPSLTSIGGLLWRMTLTPILNPPTIPPLPMPPAHVAPVTLTPKPSPSDDAELHRRRL